MFFSWVHISLFPISLASSGGSVEGYFAGEKEVLDAFNRWVSDFPPDMHLTLNFCANAS